MPACAQIVLSVEDFILGWLGIVKGVFVPSGLARSIEVCSFFRMTRKPKISNDLITLYFGASMGNFVISPILQLLQ
jgi:hypothetical protein